MEKEIVKISEELVRIPSETDKKEEIDQALEYIENYFMEGNFEVHKFEYENTKSIVICFEGVEDPKLMLHGHIDVVEAEEELFEPSINDGKLYGRGTGDMKAGVACLMKVMKNIQDEKPSVGLMIVSDEETGGFKGAKPLFEKHYSPEFAISAEPNNMSGYMDIISEQKGIMRVKVSASGKGAHGSRPWKGENAVEKLMKQYEEIQELFEDSDHGNKWVTTASLGKFEGGKSVNRVPDTANLWLDIRFSKQYLPEEIKKDLEELEIDFEVLSEEPMLYTDANNEFITGLKHSAEKIIDDCSITRKEPGSDMRHLTRNDIPAVVFGPEGYNSHASDEYAVIGSFEDYTQIVTDFALENF